ncbi:MAG TPA: outer membrane protein transport protein [Polyangiaceae bacterium]
MKRFARAGVALTIALLSPSARAGGFEIPDNGTEALGRGGAFVAKADDPTAIQYNPAGLAQQRGTRVLLDGHFVLSSYSFQRSGVYPDNPSDPKTPWGRSPFPKVQDTGGPFFAPFLAVTSDFNLDWLTAAVGVFGPSGVGSRTYPLGVEGAPSPSRYDVVQENSLIALPTAAVGVKVFDWLDLGAAVHFVYGSFSLTSTSFVDIASAACPNVEYQPCDSVSRLDVKGTGWAGTFGALIHASPTLTLGASVRTPIAIDATGTATALSTPLGQPTPPPGNATFHTELPLYARAGARLAFLDDHGFEAGDVELDGTYEAWNAAQGNGPSIHIDHLGPSGPTFDDINVDVVHGYNDTYSIRGGGAYNTKLDFGVLSLRAGAYYDRSATANNPGYTRMDFDTLDKIAGTVGIGLRWHGLQFNLAYAQIFEPDRTVYQGEGQLRPIDGAQHGLPRDANGNPLPAVNEGVYKGSIEIVSFGVVATLDDLFGWHQKKEAKPKDDAPPSPPKVEPHEDEDARAKAAPPGPPRRKALLKKSDWDD